MKCKDYIGLTVTLKRTIETIGGQRFLKGTTMTVARTYRGRFHLRRRNKDCCRGVNVRDFKLKGRT